MSTTKLQLGPADNGRRLSIQEFRDADEEEGYRFELGRGVLEVTEVPNTRHRRVVGNLYRMIARYDLDHPGVIETFGGGSEFRLWITARESGRNPDLGVVLEGTPKDERGRTQPALVAEVVSRGSRTRDYQTKREEYHLFGVREYWIVDPARRLVVVLERSADGWTEQTAAADSPIPSRLLPGLAGRAEDLWIGLSADDD